MAGNEDVAHLKGGKLRIYGRMVLCLFVILLSLSFIVLQGQEASSERSGEALFKEHCSSCHPDGGNILNPDKTLYKKDLEAYNIHTAEDIVKKMRNPGPAPTHPQKWVGMTMFDVTKISNDEALKIADYILKTFQ